MLLIRFERFLPLSLYRRILMLLGRNVQLVAVRHADVDPGGDGHLNAAGRRRAAHLAEMLRSSGLAAIYTSTYARTQETAQPTAALLGLTVRVHDGSPTELAALLRRQHLGEQVLVIGHSNTVPELLQALGLPSFTIGATEFDHLVTSVLPGGYGGGSVHLRYEVSPI